MSMKNQPIELHGSLWMTVGDANFGGRGRVALLAKIAECGSITSAAKAFKMSYKGAWDAIDIMNNLAREPLVERQVGGKGGGGTRLTQRGKQLVENFRVIELEHRRFVEQLSQQAGGIADDFLLIRRLSMKTSARNQFLGKVSRIKSGAVNDEVTITVGEGHEIVAIITRDSVDDLELAEGLEAFALIKSSSVIVVVDGEDARFSARNRLKGTVARIQTGAVNTEVVLDLTGGGTITAVMTNESCEHLRLAEGAPATAIFKASSVIVCVPS